MREHDQGKPKLNKKKPPKFLKAASQYNLNAKTFDNFANHIKELVQ